MFKGIIKFLFVFCLAVTVISCSNKSEKSIIKFSADRNSIVIKNIDQASLFQLKSMWKANPDSVNFITVLLTPGDQDSLQMEEEIFGKTLIQGDSVIFSPLTPFLKGKTYLVESYIGIKFADAGKLFKGSIKHNLVPQQQILTR
jgi:hypothetical protein